MLNQRDDVSLDSVPRSERFVVEDLILDADEVSRGLSL